MKDWKDFLSPPQADYKRQDYYMAIINVLRYKGLSVYASKDFSLRCRDKNSSQAFPIRYIFIFLFFTVYCSLFTFFGCGYTLQSRTALPFDSVQIEGIENRTVEPKLQDKFYNAVTEEFLKYGVSVQSRADYKLSGTINHYELHVLSERRDVAVEYEVIIKGDFRFVGPSGETREMKNIGSPFIVSFPVSGALENALALKELASERAIRDIAMEVVAALIYQMR
jgi:hypothetical protein